MWLAKVTQKMLENDVPWDTCRTVRAVPAYGTYGCPAGGQCDWFVGHLGCARCEWRMELECRKSW